MADSIAPNADDALLNVSLLCPQCSQPCEATLPVEPMWTVQQVCSLFPMTRKSGLYRLASEKRHLLDPPPYRRGSNCGARIRLFSTSDVRKLRARVCKTASPRDLLDWAARSAELYHASSGESTHFTKGHREPGTQPDDVRFTDFPR
jgi:hypothetical protein